MTQRGVIRNSKALVNGKSILFNEDMKTYLKCNRIDMLIVVFFSRATREIE